LPFWVPQGSQSEALFPRSSSSLPCLHLSSEGGWVRKNTWLLLLLPYCPPSLCPSLPLSLSKDKW
jgi:hypothetical protein